MSVKDQTNEIETVQNFLIFFAEPLTVLMEQFVWNFLLFFNCFWTLNIFRMNSEFWHKIRMQIEVFKKFRHQFLVQEKFRKGRFCKFDRPKSQSIFQYKNTKKIFIYLIKETGLLQFVDFDLHLRSWLLSIARIFL